MPKYFKPLNRFGWPGLLSALVWAATAASVVYWTLLMMAPKSVPVVGLISSPAVQSQSTMSVAKALGDAAKVSQAPVQNSTQYKLLGVIASGTGQGSALIAVDGQPPKAFRVGQTVHEGWVLTSLSARQARLQSANVDMLLDLPSDENKN